jgi:hypothetical protein
MTSALENVRKPFGRVSIRRFDMHLLFVTTFLFAFTCIGCCRSFDANTKKQNSAAQEWIHRWNDSATWQQVFDWTEVNDAKIGRAEGLLQDRPFMELTESEAVELSKVPAANATKSGTLYLLRAVGTVDGKFPLELYVRPDGRVWVGGGANSRCPVPMRRRAVVARLEKAPRELYVTFVVGK